MRKRKPIIAVFTKSSYQNELKRLQEDLENYFLANDTRAAIVRFEAVGRNQFTSYCYNIS